MAVASTVVGYIFTHILLVNAYGLPRGGTSFIVTFTVLAVVLLYFGWGIRRNANKPPKFKGLTAYFVTLLAHASAWTGALLTGWYIGITLPWYLDMPQFELNEVTIVNILCVIASITVWGISIIVESWCRLDDDEDPQSAGATTIP